MNLPNGDWILYAKSYRFSNNKFKVILENNNGKFIKNIINIDKIDYNKDYTNLDGKFVIKKKIKNDKIIKSNLCCEQYFFSSDYHFFCNNIKYEPIIHRKIWEYFIIAEKIKNYYKNKLKNKKGLGFAVGNEPLVPYFISKKTYITGTDICEKHKNYHIWKSTNQNIDIGFDKFTDPKSNKYFLDKNQFDKFFKKEYVDMNKLPKNIGNNDFDFLWSSCALEHLGSIEKSFKFIISSLKYLKKGGIAVHTTEYNYDSDQNTLISEDCILFLRNHFKILGKKLKKYGHKLLTMNFFRENSEINDYVDVYPYYTVKDCKLCKKIADDNERTHINLNISGYNSTSIYFVIIK